MIVEEIGQLLKVKDKTVSTRILATGPCPGLWRTYYAAVTSTNKDTSAHRNEEYLGQKLGYKPSKIQLGSLFEDWINKSNDDYNAFLTTRKIDDLSRISVPVIRDWYLQRAKSHLARELVTIPLGDCWIDRHPNLGSFPGLVIPAVTPDGVFHGGPCGAVFESKLSAPRYSEFPQQLAAYALLSERALGIDVDHAIVLHSDYPRGELHVEPLTIEESYAREVIANLYKFGKLLELSLIRSPTVPTEIKEGLGALRMVPEILRRLLRRGTRHYKRWREFLVRPDGLPEVRDQSNCPECPYYARCFHEGGSGGVSRA